MEISKKLDYTLRMLSEVARAEDGRIVSVRQVSEDDGIPYAFARTIQHELVKAGLLTTTRGPHGGMQLALDPNDITLLDVCEAVDGSMRRADGLSGRGDGSSNERFDPLWKELAHVVDTYLDSVTLKQLAIDGLMPSAHSGFEFELVKIGEA